MDIMDDNKFAEKLLDEIKQLEYGLKYYVQKSNGLERELEYYKKAYENRANQTLKEINSYENI